MLSGGLRQLKRRDELGRVAEMPKVGNAADALIKERRSPGRRLKADFNGWVAAADLSYYN